MLTVEPRNEDRGIDALEARPIVFRFHTLIAWKRKVGATEKNFYYEQGVKRCLYFGNRWKFCFGEFWDPMGTEGRVLWRPRLWMHYESFNRANVRDNTINLNQSEPQNKKSWRGNPNGPRLLSFSPLMSQSLSNIIKSMRSDSCALWECTTIFIPILGKNILLVLARGPKNWI